MKNSLRVIAFTTFIILLKNYTSAQTVSSVQAAQSDISSKNPSTSLLVTVFQPYEDNFAKVHFENYAKGKTTVKLKSSGTLLHKEVVETATYVRNYDMLSLLAGDYKIEVENEDQVYTKKITIRVQNGRRVLTII